MEIIAEVGEGGALLIKSPEAKPGDRIRIPIQPGLIPPSNEDWFSAVTEVFHEADQLDFPRRTHKEIINDLHEIRG